MPNPNHLEALKLLMNLSLSEAPSCEQESFNTPSKGRIPKEPKYAHTEERRQDKTRNEMFHNDTAPHLSRPGVGRSKTKPRANKSNAALPPRGANQKIVKQISHPILYLVSPSIMPRREKWMSWGCHEDRLGRDVLNRTSKSSGDSFSYAL